MIGTTEDLDMRKVSDLSREVTAKVFIPPRGALSWRMKGPLLLILERQSRLFKGRRNLRRWLMFREILCSHQDVVSGKSFRLKLALEVTHAGRETR